MIVAHCAVNVPCHRRFGLACEGCQYCGKGTRIGMVNKSSNGGCGITLDLEPERVDQRAFRVEFRGWPNF